MQVNFAKTATNCSYHGYNKVFRLDCNLIQNACKTFLDSANLLSGKSVPGCFSQRAL